jgi:DUF917 family protein
MPRTIGEQELRDIITGAAFMGAGGGGSPRDGLKLLHELVSLGKTEITLIEPGEMTDDEWAVMVAEIGAPRVFSEVESFPETVTAFNVMRDVAAQSGKHIEYLMAGELGGFNTMVSLYVAALKSIPFVDADGNGRAVPQMGADLYAAAEVPHSPMVMASSNGDSVVINLADPHDHHSAESIARHICTAYGQLAAFCTFIVNRDTIVDRLAPGTITLCTAIGRAFHEASGPDELADALQHVVGARELFAGTISNVELKSEGGFDFGITHIEGTGSFAGKSTTLGFKNENMLMRDASGKVIATVPDVITLVDTEALHPLTNADTKQGHNVAIFGATATQNWFRSPKGVSNWKPLLTRFGYAGDYVPVK